MVAAQCTFKPKLNKSLPSAKTPSRKGTHSGLKDSGCSLASALRETPSTDFGLL